jgi:hypothetical protein
LSIPFILDEKATVVPIGSAGERREAPERCPTDNQRREGGSVTKVVTIQNLTNALGKIKYETQR